jgi:hypothetical protein
VAAVGLVAIAAQATYVLGGLAVAGAPAPVWRALASAPASIARKLSQAARIGAGRTPTEFVRTVRHAAPGSGDQDRPPRNATAAKA